MKVYTKMVGLNNPKYFVILEVQGNRFIYTDQDRLDPSMTNKWFGSWTEAKMKAKELVERFGWENEET